jgi:hypothetical protein
VKLIKVGEADANGLPPPIESPQEPDRPAWLTCGTSSRPWGLSDPGRVEDWRHCSVGPAYLLLPVSFGSASKAEP